MVGSRGAEEFAAGIRSLAPASTAPMSFVRLGTTAPDSHRRNGLVLAWIEIPKRWMVIEEFIPT